MKIGCFAAPSAICMAAEIPGTKNVPGMTKGQPMQKLASASAAEDQEQDDPQTTIVAASASVTHSVAAASAAEDQKQDNPQTGIVVAAKKASATGIFTSASTVCST